MSLIPLWVKAAVAAALCAALMGLYAWRVGVERDFGRDEVRAEWNKEKLVQAAVDLQQSESNAEETDRRMEQQEENQRAQNEELEAARAAADRNALDAERVRQQSATAAEQWSHTLRNSPTSADLAAADTAIRVLTDVRGRLDQHAGVLAGYATAARAAGLKCERDYDALKRPRP
jgi:signal transduction histidine kinase